MSSNPTTLCNSISSPHHVSFRGGNIRGARSSPSLQNSSWPNFLMKERPDLITFFSQRPEELKLPPNLASTQTLSPPSLFPNLLPIHPLSVHHCLHPSVLPIQSSRLSTRPSTPCSFVHPRFPQPPRATPFRLFLLRSFFVLSPGSIFSSLLFCLRLRTCHGIP